MRYDTLAVIALCLLAGVYLVSRMRKSMRGSSSCGCGCDGCGEAAPTTGKKPSACGGCAQGGIAPCPPSSALDQR